MKHKLLNLYYFATDDLITHVAFVLYEHPGTEEEMCHFLLSKVGLDLSDANFGDIPQEIKDKENGVSLAKINAMMRTDNLTLIFSDVLAPYNLGDDCLHLITPIQNGKIMNQHRLDFEPLRQHHIDKFSGYEFSNHNDYLSKYYVGNTFDMAQLLKDDHFEPIHYLFNNKHYLSCIKLLFSFIDTIAWVDFGQHHNFTKWLNTYADLSSLEVTSDELWELRNSLIHMSNLDSQKVKQEKVRRISFAIHQRNSFKTTTIGDTTYFNLVDFLYIIEDAMKKWVDTYNQDQLKIITFVERYDRIVRNC
ncbi:hypothetical protein [Escherichia coli]|uniref:hypothetical protein n=1 Tax=Escherichia coli TaxID=562 RepID=UPI001E39015A|nr:hypothetical protein [Escherichia coli]MCD1388298.1 hypothetical protein [Escherichia coli]